jgi:uncharacterized protein YfaS (alpha-2-macroglobulin family)
MTLLIAAMAAHFPANAARATAADPSPARRSSPRVDEAVERGLAYLAKIQRSDGSFDFDPRRDAKDTDGQRPKAAFTGLALLAFLSAGHTPDVGRYGIAVRGALEYLTKVVPADGYVGGVDGSRMYGQAIVTLALAEASGVEPIPARRAAQHAALRRLVAVLLKAQNVAKPEPAAGGWRYTPDTSESDLSATAWCALALRAAQDAGIDVPHDALARAADYVNRCAVKKGGFSYQPGGPAQPGTTGAGVLCLYLLEPAPRQAARDGARYLTDHAIDHAARYPYYGLYYATQAAWQAEDDVWSTVSKQTLERLLKAQSADGGWPAKDFPGMDVSKITEPGRIYRTSMAVLTLTVPYRLLPIYQR